MVIRGLVFDVDDTLYDERAYILSGFADVARVAGRSSGEIRAVEGWLLDAFERGVRGDTFDRLLEAFPRVAEQTSTAMLVEAYRAHQPAIVLDRRASDALDVLRDAGLRLGILSDGPVQSQQAKVAALGLEHWFDPIILTAAHEPGFAKPGMAGFEAIARAWRIPHHDLAYVADNPEKDFAGPRKLGWETIRLRHQGQLRHELEPPSEALRPDVEISAIGDLLGRFVPHDGGSMPRGHPRSIC